MTSLCQECYKTCCPCFASKRRSSKYGYVKYKQANPGVTVGQKGMVAELESEPIRPEQVFQFPQERTEHFNHPQMFVGKEVVKQQPKPGQYGRFLSYPEGQHAKRFLPNSECALPNQNVSAGKYVTLPRISISSDSAYASADEERRYRSLPRKLKGESSSLANMKDSDSRSEGSDDSDLVTRGNPMSSSLPDLAMSHDGRRGSVPVTSDSLLRRKRRKTVPADTSGGETCWIPNLPVLEEMCLAGGSEEDSSHPLLQFSLHYDVQRYSLTVHLHHASNLPAMDRRGTSDPFVVLYMIPNKEEIFESKVVYQTLNPVFDQSFEFKKLLADDIRRQTLVLRVYDHDKYSKNDHIGGVLLPLEDADLFGVIMRMKIDDDPKLFSEVSKGDLLLALSYDGSLSTVKGLVLKATNLKKQDVIGLADPYVKIRLYHRKKVIDKWKSSIKRKTLIPVFNESFEFDIPGMDIEEVSMEILMMDYDRFSKDDVVGVIHLGLGSEVEQEQRHWRDMINGSPQVISQWHTIKSV